MTLTPAEYVIQQFGGVGKTARAIGRSVSSVSKWQIPKERRGTGGHIPAGVRHTILAQAKERNLKITSTHLDFGGPKRG